MMTDNSVKHKAELLEQLRRTIVTDKQIMATEPAKTATQLVWGDGNPAARVVLYRGSARRVGGQSRPAVCRPSR